MNKSPLPLFLSFFLLLFTASIAQAQSDEQEAFRIKSLYDIALKEGRCYDWLSGLVSNSGHRLSGSEGAEKAVTHMKSVLDSLQLDSVWLQPCTVPRWVRGKKEIVDILQSTGEPIHAHALALGNSIGTGPEGITAEIVEITDLDSLRELSESALNGKIVFFNRPMNASTLSPFHAYGGAVDQRYSGPRLAATKGAIGAVVRSMTLSSDTIAHTGSTQYQLDKGNIPAVAISTLDADLISSLLNKGVVNLHIQTDCRMLDSVRSYSVIGEIRGSTYPDEIIMVGGHLDSWDVGVGAHDDGAGCAHAVEVMHLIQKTGYRPLRTIRCVLFMNEENGTAGAREYARVSNASGEFHLAAIESDAGGFNPLGFGFSAEGALQEGYFKPLHDWWNLLEPYGLRLSIGGGGADIGPLKSQGGMLFGLSVNPHRYFDFHHSHEDTLDKVHPRELELGAAAMTALVTLIDSNARRVYE